MSAKDEETQMSEHDTTIRELTPTLLGVDFEAAVERAWRRHGLDKEPSWVPDIGLGFSSAVHDTVRHMSRKGAGLPDENRARKEPQP